MLKPLTALTTVAGALALGLVLWTAPVQAQSNDLVEVLNRINRMEADLQGIHRQLARGGSGAPSATAAPTAGGALAPTQAADFEIRLSQLERSVREVVGKYEEAVFGVNQLRDRLDKLSSDLDFRLSQLESRSGAEAGHPQRPAAAAAAAPATTQPAAAPGKAGAAAAVPVATAKPGDKRGETAAPATQAQGAAAAPGLGTVPGNIQEQYDEAFGLLRNADYDRAEKALSKFVAQHRDSPLAGNAQHWLGATFFVRGKYAEAAVAFAEGYQKYPKSNKAPDNLLKLGMSLGALGQKEDACKTLKQFGTVFPTAPASLKRQADVERKKLSCS